MDPESNSSANVQQCDTKTIPDSFKCPLTLEVMVDPVLDGQGISYERKALMTWLALSPRDPMARQPLTCETLVPNLALRDTIHEYMGEDWVASRRKEIEMEFAVEPMKPTVDSINSPAPSHHSQYRHKVDSFLESLSWSTRKNLSLNCEGKCEFRCANVEILIEVPEFLGSFFVIAKLPIPVVSEKLKDRLLELNYLQGATRK